jgi:hypothetical protein
LTVKADAYNNPNMEILLGHGVRRRVNLDAVRLRAR